jgi:hypothetical protein
MSWWAWLPCGRRGFAVSGVEPEWRIPFGLPVVDLEALGRARVCLLRGWTGTRPSRVVPFAEVWAWAFFGLGPSDHRNPGRSRVRGLPLSPPGWVWSCPAVGREAVLIGSGCTLEEALLPQRRSWVEGYNTLSVPNWCWVFSGWCMGDSGLPTQDWLLTAPFFPQFVHLQETCWVRGGKQPPGRGTR